MNPDQGNPQYMTIALLLLIVITACAESEPAPIDAKVSRSPKSENVSGDPFPNEPPSAGHHLLEFLASSPNQQQLRERIENQPSLLWDVYQTTLDAGLKKTLHQAFHADLIRDADIIVTGSYARTNAIQGGVIDYHHVYVHFNEFNLLFTSGTLAQSTIADDSIRVGAGVNADRDACSAPAKACASIKGDRVWLLKDRKPSANVLIYHVESLPIELAAVILKLRKG